MTVRRHSPVRTEPISLDRCSIQGRLAILAGVPFFADLDPAALAEVNARCRDRAIAPGNVVYLAGSPADHLFVVAAGEIKLVRYSADGQEVVVDLLGPGDACGSLAVLGDATYPDSAVAHSSACVLAIGAADFADILSRHPSVAQRAVVWLAQRLDSARAGVQRMVTHSAEARVAAVLLQLADRLGETSDGATLIQLPLARSDLAAMAGTTPETASRVLAAFRRLGYVRTGRRWVAIADRAALAAVCEAG